MLRLFLLSVVFLCVTVTSSIGTSLSSSRPQPFAFTKNLGQWPDSILFRANAGETVIWIVRDGIYYQYFRRLDLDSTGTSHSGHGQGAQARGAFRSSLVRAQFKGANPSVEVIALEELEHKHNYFLGNDPTQWRSNVPNYSGVTFKDLYPGVDVTLHGQNGRLECEQLAARQSDLTQIQIEFLGAKSVSKQSDGTFLVQTSFGDETFRGIVPDDQDASAAAGTAGAPSAPDALAIVYSTYLGGSTPDVGSSIAVDTLGRAYVTGWTYSPDFPRLNSYDNVLDGNNDIFITKLTAAGNGLVYSTFIGGDGEDDPWGIAIDAAGNAYVTGQTNSTDFPTRNAYDVSLGGGWDAFATKLSSSGSSLTYSTYVGGSNIDIAYGIAVDASGNASITGTTKSSDYPIQSPYDNSLGGSVDGFVTKFASTGKTLVFSTFLGGDDADSCYAITASEAGDVYVTGSTISTDFPFKDGLQTNLSGASDAFVTKLFSAGTLDYSTYLGGSADDVGYGITYGGTDFVFVTGRTGSTNFPTHASSGQPFQSSLQGAVDAFVAKLSHTASSPTHQTSFVYSTYIGGADVDRALGIARRGNDVYVTGFTYSENFPMKEPSQPAHQNFPDAFVTKLAPDGKSLTYSTYLGGNSTDWGFSVAVDKSGFAYVTGYTVSTNFPTKTPYQADQPSYDAFVTKFTASTVCCQGTRGNVNTTGIIDLADLSLMVAYLTVPAPNKPVLPCPDAANVNATGIVDLTDLSLLIAYLVVPAPNKPTLPNCP